MGFALYGVVQRHGYPHRKPVGSCLAGANARCAYRVVADIRIDDIVSIVGINQRGFANIALHGLFKLVSQFRR